MAFASRRPEPETSMDEHTARLTATVEHIQSDVTEIKGDIRRLDTKIDAVRSELSAKIDKTQDALAALGIEVGKGELRMQKDLNTLQRWMYGVIAAIGVMLARAFGLL
jgi:uncharacterized protein YlxW (UPF0749 family)